MTDERYMRRALQLAENGRGFTSPNPMVGCVIVSHDRIIGEGWHRCYGGPHAEVNAVNSVSEADRNLLNDSTFYVTLEPCSHYGKTPPCADLVCRVRPRRVVVGSVDPNPKVSGRGLERMREAGIEVVTGVLQEDCMRLNRRFMTAHRLRRPYVQLKWAQTADGYLTGAEPDQKAISNPLTIGMMHGERALCDAIMVGTDTANADNPSLDVRHRPARRNPLKITFNRNGRLDSGLKIASDASNSLIITDYIPLPELLAKLYSEHGVTSLMVEGGEALLESFLREGLWDEIRRETNTAMRGGGTSAPPLPLHARLAESLTARENVIETFYP